MIGKSPAFQFYPKDWLSSVTILLMPPEFEGAYIRLLAYCWDSGDCSLPDDDATLAAMSRLGEGWLKGGSTVLRKCFMPHPTKPGHLTNERLHGEMQKQEAWRAKSSEGGKASAQKRKSKSPSKGGSRVVQPKPKRPVEPNGNSSSSASSAKAPLREPPYPPPPDFIDPILWEAFREMRRGIKGGAMTPAAEKLMFGKLVKLREQGHHPTAVLEQSILNNWKDVYQIKGDSNASTYRSSPPRYPSQPNKDERSKLALLAALERHGVDTSA